MLLTVWTIASEISRTAWIISGSNLGARTFADLDVVKSGVDTIVEFANVSITFEDTRPGELSSTDFWFG